MSRKFKRILASSESSSRFFLISSELAPARPILFANVTILFDSFLIPAGPFRATPRRASPAKSRLAIKAFVCAFASMKPVLEDSAVNRELASTPNFVNSACRPIMFFALPAVAVPAFRIISMYFWLSATTVFSLSPIRPVLLLASLIPLPTCAI